MKTRNKKVLLCIFDGFGSSQEPDNNAIAQANTPNLSALLKNNPHSLLRTDGEHVGLPKGQMGNSEVGHFTIGAGRVVKQSMVKIDEAIKDGSISTMGGIKNILDNKRSNVVHLVGLYSFGGVHSHAGHLHALIKIFGAAGKKIFLHLFSDGRDVPIDSFQKDIKGLARICKGFNVTLGTVCGRYYAMDRDNRLDRTNSAFEAIFSGRTDTYVYQYEDDRANMEGLHLGGAFGHSGLEQLSGLINGFHRRGKTDEFLPPMVLDDFPGVGELDDIMFFNFRADRMRQLVNLFLSGPARTPPEDEDFLQNPQSPLGPLDKKGLKGGNAKGGKNSGAKKGSKSAAKDNNLVNNLEESTAEQTAEQKTETTAVPFAGQVVCMTKYFPDREHIGSSQQREQKEQPEQKTSEQESWKLQPIVVFHKEQTVDSLGEVIAHAGLRQLRLAETEKYAHVTYFFNCGRELPFAGEDRKMIPSLKIPTYDLQPQMSAREVTNAVLEAMASGRYEFIVVNFANADMVGHTGNFKAAIQAVECLDQMLGELTEAIKASNRNNSDNGDNNSDHDGWNMILTSDHGNAEEMVETDGAIHTQHTLNPVYCIGVGGSFNGTKLLNGSLSDIAPTVLNLLGIKPPKAMTGKSIISS